MDAIKKLLEKNIPFAVGKINNYYFLIAYFKDLRDLDILFSRNKYKLTSTKDLTRKEIRTFKENIHLFKKIVYGDNMYIYELKSKSYKEYLMETIKDRENKYKLFKIFKYVK